MPSISNIMKNIQPEGLTPIVHNMKLKYIPKQGINGTKGHLKTYSSGYFTSFSAIYTKIYKRAKFIRIKTIRMILASSDQFSLKLSADTKESNMKVQGE